MKPAASPRSWWLALVLAVFIAHGVFFALYLVPWEDESGYLFLGSLSVKGQIRLYQDEMLGERLPLPFWVLGASQLVADRSLLAARLTSLALGAAALLLLYRVGERLGGRTCAVLSVLFLATHSMIVGYYATAMYHALCSLILVGGLYALFVRQAPLAAMAIFSLLSLTRPNMAVLVPLALLVIWQRTPSRAARGWLILIAVVPPLVFFAWSSEHLKMLAYVPVLHRLVARLNYESLMAVGGDALFPDRSVWQGVAWFGRRYLAWCVAGAGLMTASIFVRLTASRRVAPSRDACLVAGLFVYLLAWQTIILRSYLKSVAAWTASFAILAALLLGYGAAALLDGAAVPRWLRGAVAAGLIVTFLAAPTYSRHTAMPTPLPTAGTTVRCLDVLSDGIAASVPSGSRVFLLGLSLPAYLAGVRPYLQQIIHTWTLVPGGRPEVVRRSGLWGQREIDEWLSNDAQYAIVQTSRWVSLENIAAYQPLIVAIDRHLAAEFRLVRDIEIYPLGRYQIYERVAFGSQKKA